MRKLLLILIFLLIPVTFAEVKEETILVLLEDGTLEKRPISEFLPEMTMMRTMADEGSQLDQALVNANNTKGIDMATRIQPMFLADTLPTDVNAYDSWRFDFIKMTEMWDEIGDPSYVDYSNIVVCVMDTGINLNHPDINIDTVNDKDFADNDDDATDHNGHGTHVAGTIGAIRDSGVDDVVGIAPGVTILPYKVFPDGGGGSNDDLAEALKYIIDNNIDVDVINMSLSYSISDSIINGYLQTLEDRGVVIIAAAANDSNLWIENETFDSPSSNRSDTVRSYVAIKEPASQTSVMAVGSVAHSNGEIGISDFSNISSLVDMDEKIDVVAPGSGIMSSNYLDFNTALGMSGTSMATPHVSGFAALLKARYPNLTAEEIKTVIRETAYEPLFNESPNITTPDAYDHELVVGSGLMNIEGGLNFSTVEDITFSLGDFTFDRDTLDYTIEVPADTNTINLSAEIMHTASATLNGTSLVLNDDILNETITLTENPTQVVLTGSLGLVSHTYTIDINRIESTNADLSSISLSEYTLSPGFDSSISNYTLSVDYTNNFEIGVDTVNPSASVTIDGIAGETQTFTNVETGSIVILVTAEDGVTTKTYTIDVTREAPSTDATLSDIGVLNESLEEVFDSSTLTYTIIVPYSNDDITLTPSVSDSNASFTIDTEMVSSKTYTVSGDFTVTIVVTAEDGVTTKTYTIDVTRQAASTDATLSGIDIVNDDLEEVFDPAVTSYTIQVPYINDGISVTPALNESHASVSIDGDDTIVSKDYVVDGNFDITIIVTAEDGVTTKTYTISVTREAASTDATLSNLVTSIYPISSFDSSTYEYTLTIPKNAEVFTVTPSLSDDNAHFTIDGVLVATKDYSITADQDILVLVTAEDGTTTKTYTIHVVVEKSSNADLSSITLDKYALDQSFDKDTLNYTMQVPYPSEEFTLSLSLNDSLSSVTINGEAALSKAFTITEDTTISIIVTAEDLSTKTYTIEITERAKSDINTLNSINITNEDLEEAFDSATTAYTILVPYSNEDITVTPILSDSNASFTIDTESVVSKTYTVLGDFTITIVVTAEDGTDKTYTINVTREAPSTDATLSDLTIDGSSVSGFASNQDTYDLDVVNSKTSVSILATTNNNHASSVIHPVSPVTLAVGSNTITVLVTAEDGSTTKTYTVNIRRAAAESGGSVVTPPVITPPPVLIPPVTEPEDTVETIEGEDGQETTVVEVSEERVIDLLEDDSIEVVEVLANQSDSARVTLDEDVLTALQNTEKPVEIQFDTVTFQMDQSVLFGLNLKASLNISCQAGLNTSGDNHVISPVFELDIHDGDDKILKINKPIPVILDYDRTNIKNKNNLAIYYLQESTGEWIYVGGKILDGNKISFEARHFSKYAIRENYKTFADISNHWGRSYIETIASREITSGVSENEFAPDKTLTIAEFVVLVTKVLGLPEYDGSMPYINVHEGDWYEPFFRKAYGVGLLTNSFGVQVDPNQPILREEMASVLIAAYTYYSGIEEGSIMTTEEVKAIDMDDVSNHFKRYVTYTYQLGLIEGDDQNRFNPQQGATRAEAAVVIKKLLILLDLL